MTRSPEVAVPFDGDDVIKDYIAKYSNWDRWGADDELGTLNHVGPEQVVAAAQLVRQGRVISLTLPYNLRGPQTGDIRANPLNVMTATGTDYNGGSAPGLSLHTVPWLYEHEVAAIATDTW